MKAEDFRCRKCNYFLAEVEFEGVNNFRLKRHCPKCNHHNQLIVNIRKGSEVSAPPNIQINFSDS